MAMGSKYGWQLLLILLSKQFAWVVTERMFLIMLLMIVLGKNAGQKPLC
jgi:hypothetical protein